MKYIKGQEVSYVFSGKKYKGTINRIYAERFLIIEIVTPLGNELHLIDKKDIVNENNDLLENWP